MQKLESVRQLIAYSGITATKKQPEGSLDSKGVIAKLGNENLRSALYFPSIVAKKFNPAIKMLWNRLTERGKSDKQIICASIRKMLHIIFSVLKSGQTFYPNHQNLAFFLLTFETVSFSDQCHSEIGQNQLRSNKNKSVKKY